MIEDNYSPIRLPGNASTSTIYPVPDSWFENGSAARVYADGVEIDFARIEGEGITTLTPQSADVAITITRETELSQERDFLNNGTLPAEEVESMGDQLQKQIQELKGDQDRTVMFPPGTNLASQVSTTIGLNVNGETVARTVEEEVTHLGIGEKVETAVTSAAAAEASAQRAEAAYLESPLTVAQGDERYYLRGKNPGDFDDSAIAVRKAQMVLVSDDCAKDNMTYLLPVLQAKGVPCVMSAISGRLLLGDNGDTAQMSGADLDQFVAIGCEVAAHTWDHVNLIGRTDLQKQVVENVEDLEARGYNVQTFVYPFGGSTSKERAVVAGVTRYGVNAAGSGQGVLNGVFCEPPFDSYRLPRPNFDTDTVATQNVNIDHCAASKDLLIYMLHPHLWTDQAAKKIELENIIDRALAAGIEIVTLQTAMETHGNVWEQRPVAGVEEYPACIDSLGQFWGRSVGHVLIAKNTRDASQLVWDYPKGVSRCVSLFANADGGWPTGAGQVITDRSYTENGFEYQTWVPYTIAQSQTAHVMTRKWLGSAWGAWEGLGGVTHCAQNKLDGLVAPQDLPTGLSYCTNGYNAVNGLPAGGAGTLISYLHRKEAGYIRQEFVAFNTSNIYTRIASSLTAWGAWSEPVGAAAPVADWEFTAQHGVTASAGKVSAWKDQYGEGFEQSTGASQPNFVRDAAGNYVNFNGNFEMTWPSAIVADDWTIALAITPTNLIGSYFHAVGTDLKIGTPFSGTIVRLWTNADSNYVTLGNLYGIDLPHVLIVTKNGDVMRGTVASEGNARAWMNYNGAALNLDISDADLKLANVVAGIDGNCKLHGVQLWNRGMTDAEMTAVIAGLMPS